MPYKRNPIRSERCCGFARYLMNLAPNALQTAAVQGFERTLDDSANRRIVLPDAFLTADALLVTFQNICEGLRVDEKAIRKHIAENPALMAERVLMELVKCGKDRQEAHGKIREVTLNLSSSGGTSDPLTQGPPDLAAALKADPYFECVHDKLGDLSDPVSFTGLSVQDTESFVNGDVADALAKYRADIPVGKSELKL